LNREADGQEPRLSHLRESGSIEQDADCVLFINRDQHAESATLTIAKHRHASTGTIKLRWIAERTRFENGPSGYEDLP
jgi:replicative DNA helicase